jgi:hypothetical protein
VLDSKPVYKGTWSQMQEQMHNVSMPLTAHQIGAMKHIIHDEYSYDPTDDGPEVSIIRLVNGSMSRW